MGGGACDPRQEIIVEGGTDLPGRFFLSFPFSRNLTMLDGHDFLLIDLDHYILSGYVRETVRNIPGFESGSTVVYSYLQEVRDGEVVWDWKSIDYPELYGWVTIDSYSQTGAAGA